MKRLPLFTLFCLILSLASAAFAQTPAHTPVSGSAERSEILNALRKPMEEVLKQPLLFKINHFLVQDGWTFIMGVPLDSQSKRINYKGTPYQKDIDDEAFEDAFTALLQKQSDGTWKVVTWQLGATDAIWITWPQDFKAPTAVFPPMQ